MRLGGVAVPYERGLLGHSDGDVLLHAVCDALLGAVGAGDMGQHFPPSDPRFRDMDSAFFVARAMELVRARGYRVANLDSTVIAERPRLSPFLDAMAARVAELLGAERECVSVKAKTAEGIGSIGAGESVAAVATVLLERPD